MTTMAPDLDMTRLALEAAVDQLTQPGDDGPSLLARLDTMPTSSLLREIRNETRPYWRRCSGLAARVRAWSVAMASLTDPEVLEMVTRQAEDWARRAHAVLDPVPPAALGLLADQLRRQTAHEHLAMEE